MPNRHQCLIRRRSNLAHETRAGHKSPALCPFHSISSLPIPSQFFPFFHSFHPSAGHRIFASAMTDAQTDIEADYINTDADLVAVLTTQLERFTDGAIVLGTEEIEQVQSFTELVGQVRSEIKKNSRKKRAHVILNDILTHNPPAFFLCALGTSIHKLSRLTSRTYMGTVMNWWKRDAIDRSGLVDTMEIYAQYLPDPASFSTSLPPLLPPTAVSLPIPSTTAVPERESVIVRIGDLRSFMDRISDQEITVMLSHPGSAPFTHFGWDDWEVRQYLSRNLFHAFLADLSSSQTTTAAGDMEQG